MRTQFFSSAIVALLCAMRSVANLQPGVYRISQPDVDDGAYGLCPGEDPGRPQDLEIRVCEPKLQEWAVGTTPDGFYTIRKPGLDDGNCGQNGCVAPGFDQGDYLSLGTRAGQWEMSLIETPGGYHVRAVDAHETNTVWTIQQTVEGRFNILLAPFQGVREQVFSFDAVVA